MDINKEIARRLSFPLFKSWTPICLYSLANPIGRRQYRIFTSISRTVHFEDYEKLMDAQTLLPANIGRHSHSNLPTFLEGLWYGLATNPAKHNWYGNVSFTIDFQNFLNLLNGFGVYQFYFLEAVEFYIRSASRILITTQDLPNPFDLDLEVYDPTIWGGPWYVSDDGTNYCLQNSRWHNSRWYGHQHQLEFFLVLSQNQRRVLFEKSRKEPVNHDEGGVFKYCRCKRYGSFGAKPWEECPSQWSIQETRDRMWFYREGFREE